MSIAAMSWAKRQRCGSPTLKAVLVAVADYADERGCCWPSQKRISEDTEFDRRTVRDALHALEEKGLLNREPVTREDGSRGADKIFLIMIDREAASPPRETLSGGEGAGSRGVGKQVPGGRETVSPLTTFEPSLEPSLGTKTPPDGASGMPAPRKTKAGKPRPVYCDEFLLLWDQYPKSPNSSKTDAYAAWQKLNAEDRDACFEGAIAYADWLASQARPPPPCHLTTFINGRRFDTILEAAE